MKRTTPTERAIIRDAGPYEVHSISNGDICIMPSWPKVPKYNERDGGGPGLGDRLSLAVAIRALLDAAMARQLAKRGKGRN